MKTNIFIPEKIRVGFQERSGTYTGKLAYVVYYDQKGVLRKEKSWESWRDKNIPDITLSNEPTSGFVLNKKAGGYSTGWNHRQTYVRVYDPRADFEFEISVPNLLYILENTNSIKGKGLDGHFVFGWDGTELLLIPTSSPDYVEISQFNKILHEKSYIKSKDLILGATYKTKDNQEWIYMGRFDYHTTKWDRDSYYKNDYYYINVNKGKHYYFAKEGTSWGGDPYLQLLILKSLGDKIISVVSDECVSNYAELFDRLERKTEYSPYDKTKDEYLYYNLEEFTEYMNEITSKEFHYDPNIKVQVKNVSVYDNVEFKYNRETKVFYKQGVYSRTTGKYEKINLGTVEDIFNMYQPVYKNEYLENGKLHRRIQ